MHELRAHEFEGHKLGMLTSSPKTICHFDATPMIRHKIYYRNVGGGISPSLGHGVFYEFGSFIVHSCTIWG